MSPTYAREIQTEAEGMGLHGLLHSRARDLVGITNGIDEEVWDPAVDRHVPAPYASSTLDGKAEAKRRLQERLGLAVEPQSLLLAVVSRLTEQKGLDLLLAAAAAAAGPRRPAGAAGLGPALAGGRLPRRRRGPSRPDRLLLRL